MITCKTAWKTEPFLQRVTLQPGSRTSWTPIYYCQSSSVSSFSSMLAAKMGPLSSKNYSLTTLGEKKRRIRELSVTNCSLVVFLCFFRSKPNHFMYIFFSRLLQKRLLYFTNHKLEQMLQVQNWLLSTCSKRFSVVENNNVDTSVRKFNISLSYSWDENLHNKKTFYSNVSKKVWHRITSWETPE